MTLDRIYFRYALRLAVGCFVVVLIYELLHLKNGYWAAFSVLGCVFPTMGLAMKRAKQRIIGTFVGMLLGIIIATAFGNHWFYLDFLIPICVFLTVYLKAFSYSFYALFNTVISVLLVCLLVPSDWQVACVRMEMTAWGVVVAILVTYFVLPIRASDEIPTLLSHAGDRLRDYYEAIQKSFLDPQRAVLHTVQLQAFDQLQKAMAVLQESVHESWNKSKHKHHSRYGSQYDVLQKTYQTLLLVETDISGEINHPALQPIATELKNLMTRLTNLFKPNALDIELLLMQLNQLLQSIQVLRVEGARDSMIPMATFREHIQLTMLIEQLIELVKNKAIK